MRARIVVLHVMLAALLIAAWRAGMLWPFGLLGVREIALLTVLAAYFAVGLGAAWRGKWARVEQIAEALPKWALGLTGIGLLLAAASLHSLDPAALSRVFRELVFAISPNVCGVLGMAWLNMLADWARKEVPDEIAAV